MRRWLPGLASRPQARQPGAPAIQWVYRGVGSVGSQARPTLDARLIIGGGDEFIHGRRPTLPGPKTRRLRWATLQSDTGVFAAS